MKQKSNLKNGKVKKVLKILEIFVLRCTGTDTPS